MDVTPNYCLGVAHELRLPHIYVITCMLVTHRVCVYVCVCMCVCVCVCVYVCVCMCVCIVRDLALCIFHRGRHSEVPSCSCQYNTALLHICHFKYASYTLHRGRHSKVLSCRCLYNTVLLYICHFTLSFHIALEPLIIGLFSGK